MSRDVRGGYIGELEAGGAEVGGVEAFFGAALVDVRRDPDGDAW